MQGFAQAKMPGNAPNPPYARRGCAAVIAGLGWFGLGVQLYFNIHEALVKDQPVTAHLIHYFSYFTIETNLLVALVLTISCARPQTGQFLTRPSVKSALVVYMIIVGVVYAVLLRNLWHPRGVQLLADMVLHYAIPFLYPLYWLVFLPKGSLRWADPVWWLVYPVLYFLYSMIRGTAHGTYPYPFLDVAQLGLERVSVNAMILLAVFFVLGVILTAIDHALGSGESGRSGLGRAAEL